jgi:betaine-aldehyde dehydrogenase
MTTTDTQVRTYGNLIHESELTSDEWIDRVSPGTGKLVARFANGTVEDVRAAIAAARTAFDHGPWPQLPGAERARILLRIAEAVRSDAERLALIEAEEVGKPIKQASGDIGAAADIFEFAAALAHADHGDAFTNLGPDHAAWVLREPVGVAALIIPWNFPGLIYSQKVAYALAAGCTMVVKPSEFTSGTAIEVTRLALEAGLPPGVVNVVTGYGDPVGQSLVESPDVDFVSFTGSTATGSRIGAAAAKTCKRVSLELGGKGANIVFADADLEDALDGALFSVFYNTGQCCVAGSRLLVQESIADEFLSQLTRRAQQLRIGEPTDEQADLGAMIHEAHADKVLSYIASATEQGARLMTGGRRVSEGGRSGIFIEPTIFDRVEPTMRIFREEIFGPVLGVVRFADVEEAIRIANDTSYGLANAVWTKNLDTALVVARRLRAGTVWINTTLDVRPQLPFGGVKGSGHGRENGQAGLEEFTQPKTCLVHIGKRDAVYG